MSLYGAAVSAASLYGHFNNGNVTNTYQFSNLSDWANSLNDTYLGGTSNNGYVGIATDGTSYYGLFNNGNVTNTVYMLGIVVEFPSRF
jgi:hypothetical protein